MKINTGLTKMKSRNLSPKLPAHKYIAAGGDAKKLKTSQGISTKTLNNLG